MNEALKLLEEIDKVLGLGEKGLARMSEANAAELQAKIFLQNNLDSDSELGREYEKWSGKTTWYQDIAPSGFANRSHLAPLQALRDFLTKFLDASDIKIPPAQQYVRTGEVFTGRRALRVILSQAKEKIDIQDNYLDQEVFALLQPYFETNANIEVRLLTTDRVSNVFKSDLKAFINQFGRVAAKTRDQAHGRFIILDSNEVYSVGHSLKDVGKKADAIVKIEDAEAKKKAIEDFENWWNSGKEIVP